MSAPTLATATGALTDREQALLAFAKLTFRHIGAREAQIRARFGLSATQYYQQLNALIDRPEAYEAEPVLVARLARLRHARHAARQTAVQSVEQAAAESEETASPVLEWTRFSRRPGLRGKHKIAQVHMSDADARAFAEHVGAAQTVIGGELIHTVQYCEDGGEVHCVRNEPSSELGRQESAQVLGPVLSRRATQVVPGDAGRAACRGRRADGRSGGGRAMTEHTAHGPYSTEAEVRADITALRSAWHAALYGAGVTGEQQRANGRQVTTDHLTCALTGAGVTLGAYDRRIAGWLADWELEVVQVVIGWVERARAAQHAQNRRLAGELHAARDALRAIAGRAQLAIEDDCAQQFAHQDVLDLAHAALGDDEPDRSAS